MNRYVSVAGEKMSLDDNIYQKQSAKWNLTMICEKKTERDGQLLFIHLCSTENKIRLKWALWCMVA